jgi:hypothetical protein
MISDMMDHWSVTRVIKAEHQLTDAAPDTTSAWQCHDHHLIDEVFEQAAAVERLVDVAVPWWVPLLLAVTVETARRHGLQRVLLAAKNVH